MILLKFHYVFFKNDSNFWKICSFILQIRIFSYPTDAAYTYCYTIFFIVSTTTEDTSPLGLFLGKIFLHSISFWEEKFVDSSTNL